MREHLNEVAPRRMAVLDPVKLVIENYPEGRRKNCATCPTIRRSRTGASARCRSRASCGSSARTSWRTPPKGYFRLFPGNKVRLRYGYVVECTGCEKDADGNVTPCAAPTIPTRSRARPARRRCKVKGNIHWVSSAKHAYAAEVRLYDRLFKVPQPGAEREFLEDLNPDSKKIITAQLEPALQGCEARGALPVRAARLLRGRPAGTRSPARRCSTAR